MSDSAFGFEPVLVHTRPVPLLRHGLYTAFIGFSNSVTVSEHLVSLGSEMGVFYGFSRVNSYTVVSGQVDRFRWSEVSCGEETASAHAMTKSTS